MKLYNTLSRKIEEFVPINPGKVGMYICGPTVYDYVTIGNWRTYVLGDLLVRILRYYDYEVDYVMNITDVGHLTGDNFGDADLGEDRLEKARNNMLYFKCKKCDWISPSYFSVDKKSFETLEFKDNFVSCSHCSFLNKLSKQDLFYKKDNPITAWDIAKFYTQDFMAGYEELNLSWPKNKRFCKATEHIQEQIKLIEKIESRGFTYKTDEGIYFDTRAFEAAGNIYGELSNLDQIKAGARVKIKTNKKDKRDFALWKFSKKDEKRHMEWSSPWGVGFPGWHIECSAMSMKYLGEQFDIHVGGEDLKSTHHPNEIAQSEAATGKKPFVKYWLHGGFLLVDGGRMGKSLRNAYTLKDLKLKGFSAMDLRYFYLTGHYRKQLNFTFAALKASQEAYRKLKAIVAGRQGDKSRTSLSEEKLNKVTNLVSKFKEAVENDLNLPQVLAVVWEMAKSNIPSRDKLELITDWEQILGLDLLKSSNVKVQIPIQVKMLIEKREKLRKENKWQEADELRKQVEVKGFKLLDTDKGTLVKKND